LAGSLKFLHATEEIGVSALLAPRIDRGETRSVGHYRDSGNGFFCVCAKPLDLMPAQARAQTFVSNLVLVLDKIVGNLFRL
jgi:hypothetical protein